MTVGILDISGLGPTSSPRLWQDSRPGLRSSWAGPSFTNFFRSHPLSGPDFLDLQMGTSVSVLLSSRFAVMLKADHAAWGLAQ